MPRAAQGCQSTRKEERHAVVDPVQYGNEGGRQNTREAQAVIVDEQQRLEEETEGVIPRVKACLCAHRPCNNPNNHIARCAPLTIL